jgi:hypothetical protein
MTEPVEDWTPDHCFIAQHVRLIAPDGGGRFRVQFADGSIGVFDGPLLPLEVVLREQVRS